MANDRWRNSSQKTLTLRAFSECSEVIVFDTETTGFNAKDDRIIELGAIKFSIPDLKEIDRLHLYIRPRFEISEKITELTGITNEFLKDKPYEEEVFDTIMSFFTNKPKVVTAHNSGFDMRFLTALAERNGGSTIEPYYVLDTLEMARDIVDSDTTANYKLGTLASLYGLDEGIAFHSALDDAYVTSLLLRIFSKEYEEWIPKSGKIKPFISSVNFWEGYKGFSRIYVQTDYGSIYYDIRRKFWASKDEKTICILDMDYVEQRCFELTGKKDINEFAKYNGQIKVAY
ncbi:MAG: 3'-5' exonuclease [Bacteroidales bacterium]|nr:3'-5' exonuclease [Bacteroidales bacterium]